MQAYHMLQLLADMHAVAHGQQLWGPRVDAALSQLGAVLRRWSAGASEREGAGWDSGAGKRVDGESGGDDGEEDGDASDAQKLAVSSEEQARLLAGRQARRLGPECLRLLKGLLSKPGAAGKSD
jgi:hypothetical protein